MNDLAAASNSAQSPVLLALYFYVLLPVAVVGEKKKGKKKQILHGAFCAANTTSSGPREIDTKRERPVREEVCVCVRVCGGGAQHLHCLNQWAELTQRGQRSANRYQLSSAGRRSHCQVATLSHGNTCTTEAESIFGPCESVSQAAATRPDCLCASSSPLQAHPSSSLLPPLHPPVAQQGPCMDNQPHFLPFFLQLFNNRARRGRYVMARWKKRSSGDRMEKTPSAWREQMCRLFLPRPPPREVKWGERCDG